MQRITAVAIVAYVVLLLVVVLFTPGMDLARWQALFAGQAFKVATFVALVAVFLHAWVGMRDIFMDYIRSTALRLTLQAVVIVALLAYTGWGIQILWGRS